MQLLPENRIAGVLAPLFALRSEHDLGVGDVGALREFAAWAAEYGFRLVQLLPVNETGNDPSPYNAISSVAIDPVTLELTPSALPDLTEADYAAELAGVDLVALRRGPVDYAVVKPLKRRLLERAYARFLSHAGAERSAAFRLWREEQAGWLGGYSLFRVLMDRNGGSEQWDCWPAPQQTLQSALPWLETLPPSERAELEARRQFFEYVQWVAFAQWEATRAACEALGVALMGDVPIGVSYYGADVFAQPGLFMLDWSGGAPPERVFKSDPFTEKWGQNWGVPMYPWATHAASGYAWWRQRVGRVRDFFHLFRVDHVLGFYRMYGFPWRPECNAEFLPLSEEEARERTGGRLPRFIPRDDAEPASREANRAGGEAILRVLQEEVGPWRLVGEDLGVVPDYVRPSLAELGIAGFKIPQWERMEDGRFTPCASYPRLSVATYATHDHPPLAALWRQMADAARAGDGHQRWELEQLGAFAGVDAREPVPYTPEIRERLLAALFDSNAWLAIVMVTDLFGSEQRFNLPGAVASTNWSERLEQAPAQWRADAVLSAQMQRLKAQLAESGRS